MNYIHVVCAKRHSLLQKYQCNSKWEYLIKSVWFRVCYS